ncbi:MAG TPA: potassium transporter TrkG [Bacteroidales bacterium]|nr:potassium transporter TrkG [Bacteroidales bacterium]HQP03703.1 potassium transporter TrkG [Bacteroidales bacterium]
MWRVRINKIREFLNIRIYASKKAVLLSLQILSVIVTIAVIASVVYYYGFPQNDLTSKICLLVIKISLVFYIVRYLLRLIYEFSPLKYLKNTWIEAAISFIMIVAGLLFIIFRIPFFHTTAFHDYFPYSGSFVILLLQAFFIIVFIVDMSKAVQKIKILRIGPAGLLSLSFMVLIFAGAGLLMLPEMTYNGEISFINALFTSTSASCVTGLTVVDTAGFFTTKGKIIIMLLIQLGGLNIITFAAYFATFFRTAGIKYQSLMQDMFSAESIADSKHLLRSIVLFSLIMEIIGSVAIFLQWSDSVQFNSLGQKIFYSVFHTVSAFNNAGFSLYTNNLYEGVVQHAYGIHMTIALLIVFGGLGFTVMSDIFSPRMIYRRIKKPWIRLRVHTKLALFTSLMLIVFGAVMFYLLEQHNAVDKSSIGGTVVSSVFQSVTCRTAGFNTVDFTKLGQPILIVFMLLMFIGASPVSTGGGIKTTTFAMLIKSAMATIRGKNNITLYKKNIPFEVIDRAYSVLFFSISVIIISVFFLTITEPNTRFIQLMFEEISAFGTVGLSTGITSGLSLGGKIIILTSMFIGRIGPLTLVLALVNRSGSERYRYPSASIIIG